MALINPRLSLKNSLINRPQIIGFNGRPIMDNSQSDTVDTSMSTSMPVNIPSSLPSTRPTFPQGGIMDRANPLNPPDDGLMALKKTGPVTPDLDNYKAYLRNAPNRADTKIGKIGGLLAGIAAGAEGWNKGAASGLMVGRSIIDRPYQRKLEDYNLKGGNLKELSDLEYRTLSDEDKKAYQQVEMNLKIRKQLTDEFKANSDVELNEAQIARIADDIQNGRKRFEKDAKSGLGYIVDLSTGTRQSVGQFAESAAEERAGNLKSDITKLGVQHANALGLENAKFGHDTYLHNLDNKAREQLEGVKAKLANMTETQKNAAFEGAFQEALTFNPGLASILYKDDGKGNQVPISRNDAKDKKAFDEAQTKMNAKIAQRLNYRMGNQDQAVNFPQTVAPLTSEEKKTGVPIVQDWNKQHPDQIVDENDPAKVRAAIELDKQQKANPQVTAPTNTVPQVQPPTYNNGPFMGAPNPLMQNFNYDIPTNVTKGSPMELQPERPPLMGNPYSLPDVARRMFSGASNQTPLMQGSDIPPNALQPLPPTSNIATDVGRGIMNSGFFASDPKSIQQFKDDMSRLGVEFPDLTSLTQAWNQFRSNAIENIGRSPLMGGSGTRQSLR